MPTKRKPARKSSPRRRRQPSPKEVHEKYVPTFGAGDPPPPGEEWGESVVEDVWVDDCPDDDLAQEINECCDVDPQWVNDPGCADEGPVPGHDFCTEDRVNPKELQGEKKIPVGLFPPAGVLYGALACEAGAWKYGPYNWRLKDIRMMTYLSAIKRHVDALIDGENTCNDAPWVPHLGSILASAAILADAIERGNLIDDRPVSGPSPRMMNTIVRTPEQLKEMRAFCRGAVGLDPDEECE